MSFEMLADFLSLSELLTVPAILSLLTVSFMGVVLGIDNVVFIAVIAKRAPKGQEDSARTLGIVMAMVARIALIFSIGLLLRFEKVHLFKLPFMPEKNSDVTVKGAILLVGGIFLIYKATQEIFEKLDVKLISTQLPHLAHETVGARLGTPAMVSEPLFQRLGCRADID